jgi:hypothetical protein
MKLTRKFPKEGHNVSYSRKQLLQLNILLMQSFFLEDFTPKELEILTLYCNLYSKDEPLLSKENKKKVVELAKLKNVATLNEYNKRLRSKYGLVYDPRSRDWTLNPVFYIPEECDELELQINLKQNALARQNNS